MAENKLQLFYPYKNNQMVSCGPFAIVYAAEILDGRSPSGAVFDVNKMREHWIICLEMQRLTRFPKVSNQYIYFNTFCS